MIGFAPEKPRYTVTVFTDVDCAFCRKLHTEIAQYQEQGIAVHYVAYPRSGPGSESWNKMASVWCARIARDALTRAKQGQDVPRPATCAKTPIAAHYALGQKLALSRHADDRPAGRSFVRRICQRGAAGGRAREEK